MLRLIAVILCVVGAWSASAEVFEELRLESAAMEGGKLSKKEIAKLEAAVKENPDSLEERAQLLGYYFLRQYKEKDARKARGPHVLWMIEHKPAERFTGSPYCGADSTFEPEIFVKAKALWEEQVKKHDRDVKVLGNAASFFLLPESDVAERLFQKAAEIDPKDAQWPGELAHLYTLRATHEDNADKRKATWNKALEQSLKALSLSTDDQDRLYRLTDVPKVAFEAGKLDEAATRADELLKLAEKQEKHWNSGNAVHQANLILGRVALRKGDVAAAKSYLLASGQTTGSPQLGSFGPNMSLAKDLLEKGERDVVIEYFDLCRKFWKSGSKNLDKWTKAVRAGDVPDFETNLQY